jgi:hypothetical protein
MNFLVKFFKTDSYAFGAFLGVVSPFLFLYLLYYFFIFSGWILHFKPFPLEKLYLLALVINLLFIRIYFVNMKMDKTGKSILAVTFLYTVLYFLIESPIR